MRPSSHRRYPVARQSCWRQTPETSARWSPLGLWLLRKAFPHCTTAASTYSGLSGRFLLRFASTWELHSQVRVGWEVETAIIAKQRSTPIPAPALTRLVNPSFGIHTVFLM